MTTKFKVRLTLTERELRLIARALGDAANTHDRTAVRSTDANVINEALRIRDFLGATGIALEQFADSTHSIGIKLKGGFLQ